MYRAIAKNKRNTVIIIALFLLIIAGLGFSPSCDLRRPVIVIITVVGVDSATRSSSTSRPRAGVSR